MGNLRQRYTDEEWDELVSKYKEESDKRQRNKMKSVLSLKIKQLKNE